MIVIQETNYITLDMWDQTIINVTAVNPGLSAMKSPKSPSYVGTLDWSVRNMAPYHGTGQVLVIQYPETLTKG
jgi:hypothetical protein